MPLNLSKYAEHIDTVTVRLESGDSFDVGYYPARMTRARHRQMAEMVKDMGDDDDLEEADPELVDGFEQALIDVFAWWDIVEEEGEGQWPVDLEHYRRLPTPVWVAIMESVGERVQAEGKASRST